MFLGLFILSSVPADSTPHRLFLVGLVIAIGLVTDHYCQSGTRTLALPTACRIALNHLMITVLSPLMLCTFSFILI